MNKRFKTLGVLTLIGISSLALLGCIGFKTSKDCTDLDTERTVEFLLNHQSIIDDIMLDKLEEFNVAGMQVNLVYSDENQLKLEFDYITNSNSSYTDYNPVNGKIDFMQNELLKASLDSMIASIEGVVKDNQVDKVYITVNY